jgi:hypothetical protein
MKIDGNSYFAADSLQFAQDQAVDSRAKLVYMSPADFLSVAMNGHNIEKEAAVDAIFKRDKEFKEIPFLNFVHDGEGTAMVTGHEGRHRAKFLESQGVVEMPVMLRHRYDLNGQGMAWKEIEANPNSFVDEWPSKLYGERGGSPSTDLHKNNFIAFPVPDLRLAKDLDSDTSAENDTVSRRSRLRMP